MIQNVEEKVFIANQIKNIDLETVDREMDKLIQIGKNAHIIGPRSRIGNNIVDYFTFLQRLETRGKYNVNFFEFVAISTSLKRKSLYKICLHIMRMLKIKIIPKPNTLF